ncbi:ribosomal protein S5 domain 2-type protein [Gorgonomyces haynaldii]|nr:ribosomal protein S5 domain 2-type protein [Gorgonomyces haynaldii]
MIAVERTTRVSAPGKVLVVGGYLVLDQKYSGLVVGLDARFHVQVQSVPSNETRIHVHSPQFTDGQWEYILKDRLVSLKSKNPFVETCLDLVFQFIQTTVDYTDHTVHVLIQGDNDFYSQQDYLERHGLPLTSESLLKVPKYNTMGSLSQVSKTGLGSSAALTTALVGAFLIHFGNLTLEKDLDLIEKMAHLVHCTAQGKIGSGFDVACAAFGTHSYRRFSPHLIEHQGLNATKICDIVHQTWDHEHLPFQLPLGFHLLLGDVNTGSNTPKMVSQVLQWRKTDPSSTFVDSRS